MNEMMATNIMINDVLDELSEENQRLFDELRYCKQMWEMLDKYRYLLNQFKVNCVCIENISHKRYFNELDVQYNELKSRQQEEEDNNNSDDVNNYDEEKEETGDKFTASRRQSKRIIKTERKSDYNYDYNDNIDDFADDYDNELLVKTTTTTTTPTKKNKRRKKFTEESDSDFAVDNEDSDYNNNNNDDQQLVDSADDDNDSPVVPSKRKVRKSAKKIRVKRLRCHWEGCGKMFREREYLVSHVRNRHTGERPFKCPDCDRMFATELLVKRHQKTSHSDDKVIYQCYGYDGCDKEYTTRHALDEHQRRHHQGFVGQFKCDVNDCDKRFFKNYLLQKHKRTVHLGDRPYQCSWPGCDKRFKVKAHLDNHSQRHEGVQKYWCLFDGCNKVYTTQQDLSAHKYAHTRPYECTWPECGARFRANNKLTDHMNGHQGLKPHKCHFPDCDVSYSARTSLEHHLKHKHNYMKSNNR